MTEKNPSRKSYIFIDGQNFYLSACTAFGLRYPNFDTKKVADVISNKAIGQDAGNIAFYTGMPVKKFSPKWHGFWTNKIAAMEAQGIDTFTRDLRYTTESDPDRKVGFKILTTREKGIDLRIALDVMEAARRLDCTDIIIVSRDQDFREVVEKVNIMADFERRDIEMWSAYPDGGNGPSHLRGIDGTRSVTVNKRDYASCIDRTDYSSKHERKDMSESLSPA